jgi:hypothetical protein
MDLWCDYDVMAICYSNVSWDFYWTMALCQSANITFQLLIFNYLFLFSGYIVWSSTLLHFYFFNLLGDAL